MGDSLGQTQTIAQDSEPSDDPEVGGGEPPDRIGRFVILDRLGAGGMGVVYAAWDPDLDRRVALKLVRPDRGSDDAHGRLLREAQAMAKLAHPHVVAVYEVGTHASAVWIAMEYIDGATLRGWLRATEDRDWSARSWTEILEKFRQAGEGLAAAHAAGLIHRDFKPDNVLIGGDGRARVADFGLVRPAEAEPRSSPEEHGTDGTHGPDGAGELDPGLGLDPGLDLSLGDTTLASTDGPPEPTPSRPPASAGDPSLTRSGPSHLSAPLTQAGAMLGTPRYMAPEQFRRLVADARSDQFSFCVALYEALFEQPPFPGERLFELAAAVTLGEPRVPPRDSPVPAPITRAIMRGLARDPGARHPDMPSLLAELAVTPQTRRWPFAVAGVAVAALVATVAWAFVVEPEAPEDPCAAGREVITQVWNPARRDQLEQQFLTVARPFAETSLRAVDDGLRGWTGAWSTAYTGACSTRHEQSAELYDLRMACLAQRRQQVGALVGLLETADAELVRDAPELVTELPELAGCDDLEGLRAVAPPAPGIAQAVADLRETLAGLRARADAHRFADVESELPALREAVAALDYAPLTSELALLDADTMAGLGQIEPAIAAWVRSHELALGSGDDRLALAAAIELITGEGFGARPEHLTIGRRWNTVATGLSRRLGAPAEAEVLRTVAFGRILVTHVEVDEGLAVLEGAVALADAEFGEDSLVSARAKLYMARGYEDAGKYAEARVHVDQAVAIYERELTPDHPLLLGPLDVRASLLRSAGKLDEALSEALRVQAIAEANYGPTHPTSIDALDQLALIHDLRGDHRGAHTQFLTVLERIGELEQLRSRNGVVTMNSLCFTHYKLGEYADARRTCAKALDAGETIVGAEHPMLAVILNNFGLIARAEGLASEGLEYDRRALAIAEASVGPDHFYTAYSLVGIGESLLALGRGREAVELLTRAVAIRVLAEDPGEIGEAECLLARARGRDEPSRELARGALAKLREAGSNWAPQIEACSAWLSED